MSNTNFLDISTHLQRIILLQADISPMTRLLICKQIKEALDHPSVLKHYFSIFFPFKPLPENTKGMSDLAFLKNQITRNVRCSFLPFFKMYQKHYEYVQSRSSLNPFGNNYLDEMTDDIGYFLCSIHEEEKHELQDFCRSLPLSFSWILNHKDKNGKTLLHMASTINDMQTVELLLNKKADSRVRDRDGLTAVDIAKEKDYAEIVRLFKLAEISKGGLNTVFREFRNYANGNVLPKWSAGLFRQFRTCGFPYGKRFDDIVLNALNALNHQPDEQITPDTMEQFLGHLKHHATCKGLDLEKYSDGKIHFLLSALSENFGICYKDIAAIDVSVNNHQNSGIF